MEVTRRNFILLTAASGSVLPYMAEMELPERTFWPQTIKEFERGIHPADCHYPPFDPRRYDPYDALRLMT